MKSAPEKWCECENLFTPIITENFPTNSVRNVFAANAILVKCPTFIPAGLPAFRCN